MSRERQLFAACAGGNLEALRSIPLGDVCLLANVTNEEGETPLLLAAERGDLEMCKYLVEDARAYVDCTKGLSVHNVRTKNDGGTPLLIAARKGHLAVAQYLVSRGANVNHRKMGGATPTYISTQEGHLEMLKFLVASGGDPSITIDDQGTCVYIAAQNNRLDCLLFLVDECHQDPTLADVENWAPLHIATQEGYEEVVRVLLDRGCDPLSVIKELGWNAAGIAVRNCRASIFRLFVERYEVKMFDPAANDSWGLPHIAAGMNAVSILQYILDKGVDPDIRMSDGLTPLHIAVRNSNIVACHVLLAYGADLEARSLYDQSVEDYSVERPAMKSW